MAGPVQTESFDGPFDGPFDIKHLEAAARWGFPRLTDAAEGFIDRAVMKAVCEAAWDLRLDLDARWVPGFAEVDDLGCATNGWPWASAMLEDPSPRWALYHLRVRQAAAYARREFSRLNDQDMDAGVAAGVYRASRKRLDIRGTYLQVPAWLVKPVFLKYVEWELLTVARKIDKARLAFDDKPYVPLSLVLETGERGIAPLDWLVASVDDLGIDAAPWHQAASSLAEVAEANIAEKRKGSAREKAELTYNAATLTLQRGAADAEVRECFGSDPLLCCFHSLRAVATPGTWAVYPYDKVPTRDVLAQVARDVTAQDLANAAWFKAVEARRKELNDKGRLLHGIKSLVAGGLAAAGAVL